MLKCCLGQGCYPKKQEGTVLLKIYTGNVLDHTLFCIYGSEISIPVVYIQC